MPLIDKMNARIAAKLSFWSPFVGCAAMVPVGVWSGLTGGKHPLWTAWFSAGVFGLVVVAGFAFGCAALVQMKGHGWQGIAIPATIGVCVDAALICLFIAGLRAIQEPTQNKAVRSSPGRAATAGDAVLNSLADQIGRA